MVRAKFVCNSYETSLQSGEECRTVKFTAVVGVSPENKEFFKWTPNGQITIGLLNQKAWSQFKLGGEYFIDFTPVEESPSITVISQPVTSTGITFQVDSGATR